MAASKLKLAIEQGATFRKRLTWKTGTPLVAVNLTSYTARMQIRATIGATEILTSLTTENGGITITAITGVIELFISATNTALITWDTGVYDLELIAPNADVTRLIYGTVGVSKGVTR